MENIKKFLVSKTAVDVIIIIAVMLLCTFLLAHPYGQILPDRGRELLIPQEILNGKIPYKDITLVYFPFAYYINALIYKIFGVFINSVIGTVSFVITGFMIMFYFLSKEFLSRKLSLLITLTIIISCVYGMPNLFNYILPYSYARLYGIMGFWLLSLSFVKFFRIDNIKYLYLASVAAGFSVCCKLEFLSAVFVLAVGLFLHKRLKISQYIKVILSFLIFPVISVSILVYQGVTFDEIYNSIKFGVLFSQTGPMTNHLRDAGLYPKFTKDYWEYYTGGALFLLKLIFLSFSCLYLKQIFKDNVYSILVLIVLFCILFNEHFCTQISWAILPMFMSVLFILFFRKFLSENKALLFLIFVAIVLSQREFFGLNFNIYGTYSFPLLLLSLLAVIEKYIPKTIASVKTDNFISLCLILFSCTCMINISLEYGDAKYKIESKKGYAHTKFKTITKVFDYVNAKIPKDATLLVLPEGAIINFLTDRKVDMHCFMMDRLYHDAYGEEKARDMIAASNSDYIIIFKGVDLSDFRADYLYSKSNLSTKYIYKNYDLVKEYNDGSSTAKIFKIKGYHSNQSISGLTSPKSNP